MLHRAYEPRNRRMPVHALTQVDPTQFFRLPSANGTGTQRLDTKVSGVAVSNDFSGRLSVTTAEGDTITLSADLESDFRAVDYKAQAEGDGKTVGVDAMYAEYSLKHEFGVTIEGDLNEEEVKDLTKLFRNVANIFKQYVSDQDDEALAKTAQLAERFGNLSSLSGLDLSVDVERSVTVLAAHIVSEVAGFPALPIDRLPQIPPRRLTQLPRVGHPRRLQRSCNRPPVLRCPPGYRSLYLLRIQPTGHTSVSPHRRRRDLGRWCSKV